MRRRFPLLATLPLLLAAEASAAVVNADPGSYLALLPTLKPGDTMLLAPGDYGGGLPIWNLRGQPGRAIAITGPSSGPPARLLARSCCNTVSIGDSSFVEIRSLTIDGQGLAVDAVKAESTATSTDHVTLEALTIVGHGADQQIVGINTKCPSWGWIVRGNTIVGAGTGMYFGDSDGSAPFVAGLVEHNLVADTIGYNVQVKHQVGRPSLPGMPQSAVTVIRNNVFSKANGASTGADARPNLLVGHWPLSGPGAGDHYEIYGNVFYQNPTEALFQGEGNVVLYQNLFVNRDGSAVHVQPQNDVPRLVRVFHNTIVARDTGIRVSGGDPGFTQDVVGNAVFAGAPLQGGAQVDNVTDAFGAAGAYLNAPGAALGSLDLHPLPGALAGSLIATAAIDAFPLWSVDWNGNLHDGTRRGAYATSGTNPGWLPSLATKPVAGDEILAGQGLAQPNPNRVRAFSTLGAATLTDFLAYGAGAYGVNVAAGAVDGNPGDEILTGPGPGAVFGPQVRGFAAAGAPLAKVNYYAYGTLKWGVNLAYGDLDADLLAEIVTAPGPGIVFSPQVRGWNHDGAPVTSIAKINFNAFSVPEYGANVAAGDVDGDAHAEMAAAQGPGPDAAFPARFLGFDYDGVAVAALPGFDVTPFGTMYGGRVGLGDVSLDGRADLLVGAGRDPLADARVESLSYIGGALTMLPGSFVPFSTMYGVNVASGTLGH